MKAYQIPKIYTLQDYSTPVYLQATGIITPDCEGSGGACASDVGFTCTPASDWLVLFELINTNCSDTPDPLALGCQIEENSGGVGSFIPLSGCTLNVPCSTSGCTDGAVYEILCPAVANPGDCTENSDLIRVVCPEGISPCDDENPPPA